MPGRLGRPRRPAIRRLGALILAGAVGTASAGALRAASPGGVGTPSAGAEPGAACENFGQVGPGLYRGAEPDDACLDRLAARGIRTIVNLRDERDASERERSRAAALGMRYVNQPMSGFGRPALPEVRTILATLLAAEGQPVFVHCKRGRDRTGVVIAAYRMAHDGWAADRAVDEAKRFGLAWWQVRMKRFIQEFEAAGD